ncbi:MAG: hypothetical protein ACKVW3_03545 [Phycisphaerales bacterium]
MRTERSCRAVAAVVVLTAGTMADAQIRIDHRISWSEVLAGSNQPVPTPNGLIEPGEAVRIAIKATVTPGIGATVPYTQPSPPGVGTIAGIGSILVDILGTNVNGGTWSNITRNAEEGPSGIPGGGNWTLGGPGWPEPNGDVSFVQAGQFVTPGQTCNSTNPIENMWRATWTPSTYQPRDASFRLVRQAVSQHMSSIVVQYGIDPNGNPLYLGQFVLGEYGDSGSIPIVPSPGVLPIAGVLATVLIRRLRR